MKYLGDNQDFPKLRGISKAITLFVLLWCPLGIASWIFNLPRLTTLSVGPSRSSVPTITGFILIAIALLVTLRQNQDEKTQRSLQAITLAPVLLPSIYILCRYLFIGLQDSSAEEISAIFGANLGYVAFSTALCFVLLTSAMLLGRNYLSGHLATLMTTLALVIAYIAIVGYAFDSNALNEFIVFTAMSLPTAIGITLLCCAALLARPTLGWTARIIGPDSGGVAARRLMPAVFITPFLLGFLIYIGVVYGKFGTSFGFALLTTATTVSLGAIVYLVSVWLARRDIDLTNEVILRRATQQKLQSQNERLSLLDKITRGIAEHQDDISIFQIVSQSLEDRMPVDFVCFGLCNPSKTQLIVRHVGTKSIALAEAIGIPEEARIDIDGNGLSACIRGELVYEPDTQLIDFPFPVRLAKAGLQAVVMVPLVIESEIHALLITGRHDAQSFTSTDCEFLHQLCNNVAIATHQSQLRQNIQRAYDDMRDAQQSVMQHERLRALGQMASGIAHDINNAVAPISIRTQSILETETNLSPPVKAYLTMVDRQTNDIIATIGRLREFYREQDSDREQSPVEVNTLVNDVVEISSARWKDMARRDGTHIDIKTELAEDLPRILGKDNELREVLVNLVFNAVDALPDGGIITIRTSITGDARGFIRLEVADNGVGMSEESIRRCMEPFYTTKGDRGTGLGLAMVHGILNRHDANISIKSAKGEGTSFILSFPVPAELEEKNEQSATRAPLKPMRLLLIDDDAMVLDSLVAVLELDGHDLTGTTDARNGIDQFTESLNVGKPFDAVITDLGMPHLDGNQVSHVIKRLSPNTPIILLTGWGQRLGGERDKSVEADFVMGKPPKLSKLRDVLTMCQNPS